MQGQICLPFLHLLPLLRFQPIEPMHQPGKLEVPLVSEAELLHHPLGDQIGRQRPRADFGEAQPTEADIQTGLAHLRGESLVPELRQDGIRKADCIFAVDLVRL